MVASPIGVGEDFVGGIERLGFRDRVGRAVVEVGMVQLREDAVGGADLGVGATSVQAERGVGIRRVGFQRGDGSAPGEGANPIFREAFPPGKMGVASPGSCVGIEC